MRFVELIRGWRTSKAGTADIGHQTRREGHRGMANRAPSGSWRGWGRRGDGEGESQTETMLLTKRMTLAGDGGSARGAGAGARGGWRAEGEGCEARNVGAAHHGGHTARCAAPPAFIGARHTPVVPAIAHQITRVRAAHMVPTRHASPPRPHKRSGSCHHRNFPLRPSSARIRTKNPTHVITCFHIEMRYPFMTIVILCRF
jgi:hypothetical protein